MERGHQRSWDSSQAVLEALTSSVRRSILWLVWNDEMSAGMITRKLELSGPTVSQHLAILRDAGLVTLRSEGTFRFYRARQETLRELRTLLGDNPDRWVPGSRRSPAVARSDQLSLIVETTAPCDAASAFRAFTDGDLYTRWLGAPVTIDNDGRVKMTMEWGVEVRGVYDVVAPPDLIAMTWSFGLEVPLPGEELVAYLRIFPQGKQCRVVVHQLADTEAHREKLGRMWGLVLERFRLNILPALKASKKRAGR